MQNEEYQISNLKIKDLEFDIKNYQRETSEIKIKNIVRSFDWKAFGFIYVNERSENEYWVVDGQHRTVAAARKGYEEVPCMIYKNLTLQEEAELFINCQVNRNSVRMFERYQALLTAGDKTTIEIQNILEKYDIKPSKCGSNENGRKKGYLNGIASLYKIYNSKGSVWLEIVIRIVTSIWQYNDKTFDPDSLTSNILLGMHTFLCKAYNIVDEKRIIKKMKNVSASKLNAIARRNIATYGDNKASNTARAILEEYNNRNQDKLKVTF